MNNPFILSIGSVIAADIAEGNKIISLAVIEDLISLVLIMFNPFAWNAED